MPKSKTLRIRPKANADLSEIYEYSYREFGSRRADQYIRQLDVAFQSLVDELALGNDYSHIRPDLKGYSVVSHVVFFKRTDYGVNILRVLHKSMDYG